MGIEQEYHDIVESGKGLNLNGEQEHGDQELWPEAGEQESINKMNPDEELKSSILKYGRGLGVYNRSPQEDQLFQNQLGEQFNTNEKHKEEVSSTIYYSIDKRAELVWDIWDSFQSIENKHTYLTSLGIEDSNLQIPDAILENIDSRELNEVVETYNNLKSIGESPTSFNDFQEKGRLIYHDQNKKNLVEKRAFKEKLDGAKYLDSLDLPGNFREIGRKMISKLKVNEVLKPSDPIALVDARSKKLCYIVNGKVKTLPIIIGAGGISRGYSQGDKKTIIGEIHRFDPNISKIATSPYGDASNSGSKTVKGASIQSALSQSSGGRYFHGVADHRIPGGGTWGCVGMKVNDARTLYKDVVKNGKGYGYVDV